jgi:hypothetical protein
VRQRAQGSERFLINALEVAAATARRSIMSINLALCVSAAFSAAIVCFDVLELEPKTTTPPMMAASAAIMVAGSNLTTPSK